MAKTLINSINEVLKRVNVIAGDGTALTTLTDSARQHPIDIAIQCINEGIDELYSVNNKALPREQGEGTLTLIATVREYALVNDVIQLRFPLIDRDNNQYIFQFPGDYNDLLMWDTGQSFTGLPHYGVISPLTGRLYLDRTPMLEDQGKQYRYQYDRDMSMDEAGDEVPFTDAVFRAMVPVWVQLYKREMKNEFDEVLYKINLGRAARFATLIEPRTNYSPR